MNIFQSRLFTVPFALGLLAVLLFAGSGRPRIAHATATFTVNSAGDADDISWGDGVCETGTGNGVCTLRAAIRESNFLSGTDTINFAIGGGGFIATISPTSTLPTMDDVVTIDGATQCLPSYCLTGVDLSGLSCTGCTWGLGVNSASTVSGMRVNDFSVGAGIAIGNALGGSTITNNLIGNNTVSAMPNAVGVIVAASAGNNIGPGNTISGNTYDGVWITSCFPPPFSGCGNADNNHVFSNYIGIDGAGTGALANGASGVDIDASGGGTATGNLVGCVVSSCGQAIGGNGLHGVYIRGASASANIVSHVVIGETCPGPCPTTANHIPNGGHGIYISGGAHDNRVGLAGGDATVYGSDIAFNHGAGFAVDGGGTGNQIFTTTIRENDGLGVDIDPIAPIGTTQDPTSFAPYITPQYDAALTSALYCPGCAGGGVLSITGYGHGAPPGHYFVDVYRNLSCDPSGYGEGALPILPGMGVSWYVPPAAVTTDTDGNVSGAAALSGYSNIVGQYITSRGTRLSLLNFTPTADATGEFGKCLPVKLDSDGDGVEDSIDTGDGCFSDGASPKPTFGCIVDRNTGSSNPADDCYVSVVDLPAPDGVVVGNVCPAMPNVAAAATVDMCGLGTVTIRDGGSQIDTCGSFRSGNLAVPADFDFSYADDGQYVLHQPADTKSIYADVGSIVLPAFSVVNLDSTQSHYPVDVQIGLLPHHVILPPGTSTITTVLKPQGFRVENTASMASITVDGTSLPAGEMTAMCVGDCDFVSTAGLNTVLGDGCPDVKEPLLVPPTSPTNPWDFFSVPVPALFAAPNPLVVFKDATVAASDAQAIFAYFKKSAHTGNSYYEQDLNANGVKDGIEYDRSVAGPGQSGPPDGVISAQDAQLAFAQFKKGYHC